MIVKEERARFLAETRLDLACGPVDIECSQPGGKLWLLDYVATHRYFMAIDRPDAGEPTFEDAGVDWYNHVYQPIVKAIESKGLRAHFPGAEPTDVYVWVSQRILQFWCKEKVRRE